MRGVNLVTANIANVTYEAMPKKQKGKPPTNGPLGRGTTPTPFDVSGHAVVLGHVNIVGPGDPKRPITVSVNDAGRAPARDAWPRVVHTPSAEPPEIAGAPVSPRSAIIANWLS